MGLSGWGQPREVACEALGWVLKVSALGMAAVAVVVEQWLVVE